MVRKYISIIFIVALCCITALSNTSYNNSKLSYFINEVKQNQYNGLESISLYDSIIKLYSYNKDSLNIVKYMIEKGTTQSINSNNIEAYKTFGTALNILNKIKIKEQVKKYKNKTLLCLAKESRRLGLYDESIEKCFEILINNNNEDTNQTIVAYSLMSIAFMSVGNEQTADEYSVKAYQEYLKDENINSETQVILWNCMAGIKYSKGEYNMSIQYLNNALEHIENSDNPSVNINIVNNNIANVYFKMKEYTIARRSYEKILMSLQDKPNSFYKAETLLNLANTYYQLKDYTQASKYYHQSIDMSKIAKAYSIKAMAMIGLSNMLFETKDYKKSRVYLGIGKALWDSISNVNNIAKLNILKSNFENRELIKDKEILGKELEILSLSNKNKGTLLFAISMLLILSTSVIIVMIKKINKYNKKRIQLTATIDNLQHNEKEIVESVKQQYDNEIDAKNEKLKALAQAIVKSHDIINKVTEANKYIMQQNNIHGIHEKVKELQNIINSHRNDRTWYDFELYFEQQYSNFYKNIKESHPDLTQNEMQLCTLIVIDMNAKDIATFTNKSVRTIESTIYRTRKKLNIHPDTKTNIYLKTFI